MHLHWTAKQKTRCEPVNKLWRMGNTICESRLFHGLSGKHIGTRNFESRVAIFGQIIYNNNKFLRCAITPLFWTYSFFDGIPIISGRMSGLLCSGRQNAGCGYPPSVARRQNCGNGISGLIQKITACSARAWGRAGQCLLGFIRRLRRPVIYGKIMGVKWFVFRPFFCFTVFYGHSMRRRYVCIADYDVLDVGRWLLRITEWKLF